MSLITRLAAAAGLAAVLAAPAFAQTTTPTALNGQLNWGDVVADINVVTRDGAHSAAAVATAAGNAVSGANVNGGLDAESEQTMSGATFAYATLEGGNVRDASAMSTAQAQHAAGADHQRRAQSLPPRRSLTAATCLPAPASTSATRRRLSAVSSAASNNAATAADHGDLNVALTQSASNSAYAITDVDACCTGQTAAGASSAINAWSSSSTTSTVNAQYDADNPPAPPREATTDVYQIPRL